MSPTRILVIQLRRIGDVLLTTPAVAALKRAHPGAQIDFLVEPPGAEILEGNPDITNIIVYKSPDWLDAARWVRRIRNRRYDWVIDFMGNPRTAILTAGSAAGLRAGPGHVGHRWAYNHLLRQSSVTQYAGREKVRLLKALDIPQDEISSLPRIHLAVRRETKRRLIGFAPASRKPTRQWPAASYIKLGRLLREDQDADILVFWGPGEEDLAREIASGIGQGARPTPETRTLKEAAALMSECRLLVTNCNGPKHMAVALGVPTVTIHGSSDPVSWTPDHPLHRAVRQDDLHCIGCGLNRCPYALECMTSVSPERVFAVAQDLVTEAA